MIRATGALLVAQLRIATRERAVLFFNFIFPLVFFFLFGELTGARQGEGTARTVLAMVLAIGIIGNGLFGVGIRSVQEREQNILRRLRLTPISPVPILLSGMIAGIIVFLPTVIVTLWLSNWVYNMPVPGNLLSLFAFVIIANAAFKGIGLIIASVANSMNEAQILIQLLYFPMLFLSGATFPVSLFPGWLQVVSRFIPATYLTTGINAIVQSGESLWDVRWSVFALIATFGTAFFIARQLFRWDKDDRLPGRAKIWVVVTLLPFVVMGVAEGYLGTEAVRQTVIERAQARNRNWKISGARVFTGDTVLDRADVYVNNGKIVSVVAAGEPAPPDSRQFTTVDAAGKTLLPGLIDIHAHLGVPGVLPGTMDAESGPWPVRALQSYLYSGVTAVKSVGDVTNQLLEVRNRARRGEIQGAELFMTGPLFTAPGGHGTEYFERMPTSVREQLEPQMAAAYTDGSEAAKRVDDLARLGVDGIKLVLEAGGGGRLFERLDLNVFAEVVRAGHRNNLPVVVHTGSVQDIRDALSAGIEGLEHGAMREDLPDDVIAQMVRSGVAYDPTLAVLESIFRLARKDLAYLDEPLILQVIPMKLLNGMKSWVRSNSDFGITNAPADVLGTAAARNLKRVSAAGGVIVLGTDAGNPGTFHGPAVFREMEIWSSLGISNADILKAATLNNAKLLGADVRIGRVAAGYDANLLIVDGDPLKDIAAMKRIADVFFKGERVRRSTLFAK